MNQEKEYIVLHTVAPDPNDPAYFYDARYDNFVEYPRTEEDKEKDKAEKEYHIPIYHEDKGRIGSQAELDRKAISEEFTKVYERKEILKKELLSKIHERDQHIIELERKFQIVIEILKENLKDLKLPNDDFLVKMPNSLFLDRIKKEKEKRKI